VVDDDGLAVKDTGIISMKSRTESGDTPRTSLAAFPATPEDCSSIASVSSFRGSTVESAVIFTRQLAVYAPEGDLAVLPPADVSVVSATVVVKIDRVKRMAMCLTVRISSLLSN
jgi:hypothetical protein